MKVSDFDYELPPERIAQQPAEPRDSARLLVHEIASAATTHSFVRELPNFLERGDLLVVNDTRVRSARLVGRRASGGSVEFLLLEALDDGVWRALAQPAARLKRGETIVLEDGALTAEMLERPKRDDGEGLGEWRIVVRDAASGEFAGEEHFDRFGRMPLPPYIHRPRGDDARRELDRASYQTVFAAHPGAVAAPTAGLHFTPDLLAALEARGVERASVTLHVGEGTFRAVEVEDTSEHRMHAEHFELPRAAALAIERCRARGGRVVAVGTTSARVLESCASANGLVEAKRGETRLFITPPREFAVVDVLLTNFHLPRSTLLMLVSAFAGRERVLALYRDAIDRGYRFYSYGDAMLLAGARR